MRLLGLLGLRCFGFVVVVYWFSDLWRGGGWCYMLGLGCYMLLLGACSFQIG